MPKESRKRTVGHDQSVRWSKRQFAVHDNAVERVEIGASAGETASRILKTLQDDCPDVPALKKKEKQQLKRGEFLERLASSRAPYSKNHSRRLKRKAKEQIASGLDEIKAAINALEEESPSAETHQQTRDVPIPEQSQKVKLRPGQIGEGRGSTLSKSQRKRALELERLRYPLILSNPEFASNPFETIRTHAHNTLLKHQSPST